MPHSHAAPSVDEILEECRQSVNKGLNGKKLTPQADKQLDSFYRSKVEKRLKAGGDWPKEKGAPLVVAEHLGQICAILAQGPMISATVARAAAEAVKDDEVCPAGGGAGQWCV